MTIDMAMFIAALLWGLGCFGVGLGLGYRERRRLESAFIAAELRASGARDNEAIVRRRYEATADELMILRRHLDQWRCPGCGKG
jgi:hypothetical protein